MFSIVTVSFNSGETIRKTIESVLCQTFREFEYIIVDGGSTDNTIALIRSYTGISKLISESDRGIYDAMNKGISFSTQPFLIFLNSDDSFYDDKVLEKLSNSMNVSDSNTIYYTDYVKIFHNKSLEVKVQKNLSIRSFYFKQPINHQSTIFPRNVFGRVGPYDINVGNAADYCWFVKSFDTGIKYSYLPVTTSLFDMAGVTSTSLFKNYLTRTTIALAYFPFWIKARYILLMPYFFVKFRLLRLIQSLRRGF